MPDPEIPHQEYVSADVALPPEMLASMSRRRAAHQEALRERWAAKMLLRPTAEEIALRRKMRDTLSAMVAPRETIDRMNAGRRQRFQEAKAIYRQLDLPRPILPAEPEPLDANGIGTLWWASTSVSTATPNNALIVFFRDGILNFGGAIDIQSEDLLYGYMNVFAQFGLGPDRMPVGTQFVSNPFVRMLGVLDGAVFGSLFDFGDQWSKCWLNTKQSVLVPFTAVGIPSYLLIGQNAQSQALIFIETSGGSDIERYTFSGITSLPPVSFPMDGFARANGIEVDLEIDLYMQLEGDNSGLHFHAGEGGGTDTLQTLQWDLQPG